jgi:hypothetical protein
MSERIDWMVLGRTIGTATGWDGDMEPMIIYDFIPYKEVKLPHGDLSIDFMKGLFITYDPDGNEVQSLDMIEILMTLPKEAKP